jgi:hypothetical protein
MFGNVGFKEDMFKKGRIRIDRVWKNAGSVYMYFVTLKIKPNIL